MIRVDQTRTPAPAWPRATARQRTVQQHSAPDSVPCRQSPPLGLWGLDARGVGGVEGGLENYRTINSWSFLHAPSESKVGVQGREGEGLSVNLMARGPHCSAAAWHWQQPSVRAGRRQRRPLGDLNGRGMPEHGAEPAGPAGRSEAEAVARKPLCQRRAAPRWGSSFSNV